MQDVFANVRIRRFSNRLGTDLEEFLSSYFYVRTPTPSEKKEKESGFRNVLRVTFVMCTQ